jgi:hypothetical protein
MKHTFTTPAEANAFIKANRENMTRINNLECGPIYPMFNTISPNHVSFYHVDKYTGGDHHFMSGPFTITTK